MLIYPHPNHTRTRTLKLTLQALMGTSLPTSMQLAGLTMPESPLSPHYHTHAPSHLSIRQMKANTKRNMGVVDLHIT